MVQSKPGSSHESHQQTKAELPDVNDFPRDTRFWLILIALSCTMFLTSFEATVVSPALPVIAHDLQGASFIWVGSAYMLAATACIPLSGGLAHAFGRKSTVLVSLALIIIGSALCGASHSMSFLIASRVVQGMGGGGATATSAIIISDLVPLRQRGVYSGYIQIAWAVAAAIGPVVGGALAQKHAWRWIFYLNIPFCVAAAILLGFCLRPVPTSGTLSSKFKMMDWCGIISVMASSVLVATALTWGGDEYAWTSAPVLATLIIGAVGLAAFLAYEFLLAKNPLVPFSLMSTRTGLSGYLQTSIFPIVVMGFIYYLPVYYQACKGASAIQSGVWCLSMALVLPISGILAGVSVKKSGTYRIQLWLAWILMIVGSACFILLTQDSSRAESIGLTVIPTIGMGILFAGTYFPVLAPVPPSLHGRALSFFMFLRTFAWVWGVTIGGAVLQNGLKKRIPSTILDQIPGKGASVVYAAIPLLPSLPAEHRRIIEIAFAKSMQDVWKVMTGIAALGLLVSLPMKALKLHTELDDDDAYIIEEGKMPVSPDSSVHT